MKLEKKYYIKLIKNALLEDLLDIGDVTSEAIFGEETGSFKLLSKDNGILSGKDVFCDVFNIIDSKISCEFYFNDKDKIKNGDVVAHVKGNVLNILKGERTALNFICHLSGIATKTAKYVDQSNDKMRILDTRKTVPGLRFLQKYAVFCGGGTNHRMGLYDMIMIKDNHIDAAGGITNAVKKVRSKWGNKYKIEVETRNLIEVEEALKCGVDRIMLDNMDLATMKKAVDLIDKRAETEASGNVTIKRISAIADTGVDFVSSGALTHTITVYDFSLKKENK